MSRLVSWLARAMGHARQALFLPRRVGILLVASLAIGMVSALSTLPLGLVTGNSAFWDFPQGAVGGSPNVMSAIDMTQVLVGYRFLLQAPWGLPLLQVARLGAPDGTNIFWLDAIPLIILPAKLLFTLTGLKVNLIGLYLLACAALSGVAMTALLAAAGQRNLAAVLAGSLIANATPFLLYRWGHAPLCAQFLLIFGLALYLLTMHRPREIWIAPVWIAFVLCSFLTNVYLCAMVGLCWTAALVQRRLNGDISLSRTLLEAVAMGSALMCLMFLLGVLTGDLRQVVTSGFGLLSTNLAGYFVPQFSGVIPALATYRIGMGSQYEGFSYLGMGALLLLAVASPAALTWLRTGARRHAALIAILGACFLFALSNRVFVGSHLVVAIPLPERLINVLGAFRSSGRFAWLPGYALMAGGLLLILRDRRAALAMPVLALACVLQVVDAAPLRHTIAMSARYPAPSMLDRHRAVLLAARATSLLIFPSFGCVEDAVRNGSVAEADTMMMLQANMEFQLIAARANLPINSVYNARLSTDCRNEAAIRAQKLRPGQAYVVLSGPGPADAQLDGWPRGDVCFALDWVRYCLLPGRPPDR